MSKESYPFYEYIQEDKSHYPTAKSAGYVDDDELFLIGDSGGFLMNIQPGDTFVNTELLYPIAEYYRNNQNHFTRYKVDSTPHRQFRRREQHRRKYGFKAPCLRKADGSIRNVRITGSHYNFINYTMIEQLDESSIKLGVTNTAKKYQDFPKFMDAQFWIFHVMEFAERNGFHLLIDKTRRGGFSYIMAADSSNIVNNESSKVCIHVANDSKYLTQTGGLTDFSVNNLRFLEEKSPFVRGIFSQVKSDFRLGYKLPSGIEAFDSWRSALISVSANNNPNCAIGKDAVKVKVEEVSTMNNFDEFMEVTEPAMRTGAYTTGMLTAWGTATSGNMQVFESNFYNPKAYNFMPFENVWDKDCRGDTCGFFKPYCWGLQGQVDGRQGLDKDGNSDILVSLEIAKRERQAKKDSVKSYSEYINYLGQYAILPSESFSSASENIFSSEELTKWEERLRVDKDLHFYTDGMLEENSAGVIQFKSNARLRSENKKTYDYIFGVPRRGGEDPMGCIRRWFAPEYTETVQPGGQVKREIAPGTYSISYDPVGIDKDKKQITLRHSHNSIKVWMNPCALNGFKQKLVAAYYGRPDRLEEADRICLYLAKYYNCIRSTNVEVNRGETVNNFKKWGALKYLAFEPLFVWDTSLKGTYSNTYGYVISDGVKKLDALRLLREMLYEVIGKDEHGDNVYMFQRIYDYQTIIELKKWSAVGNFDRVSEMLVRAIEYKSMDIEAMKELSSRKEITEENDFFGKDWF